MCESFPLKQNEWKLHFSSQKTTNLVTLIIFFWNRRFLGVNTCSNRFSHPQHLSPSTPFSDAHIAPEQTAPKLWSADTENRGRNTPAIGSSGSAESVRSHNVPLYYRWNYISIRIIKNVKIRCAAKCTLSSVSLSLYDTSLPLLLVSETDWRPNSGQNR